MSCSCPLTATLWSAICSHHRYHTIQEQKAHDSEAAAEGFPVLFLSDVTIEAVLENRVLSF